MAKAKEKKTKIQINEKWCKKCGICIEFCPSHVYAAGVLGEPRAAHLEKCTQCRLCEIYCPEFCITVSAEKEVR